MAFGTVYADTPGGNRIVNFKIQKDGFYYVFANANKSGYSGSVETISVNNSVIYEGNITSGSYNPPVTCGGVLELKINDIVSISFTGINPQDSRRVHQYCLIYLSSSKTDIPSV